MKKLPFILLTSILLTACGGGGGGGSSEGSSSDAGSGSGSEPDSGSIPSITTDLGLSSYQLSKHGAAIVSELPPVGDARAYGDFFGDGTLGLFGMQLTYSPTNPIEQATPATVGFWKRNGSNWESADVTIHNRADACIHPRKAAIGDIMGNGLIDIVVACHGYDAGSYPGERIQILVGESDGSYTLTRPDSVGVGFWHSLSLRDMNGNGASDIVLVNPSNSGSSIQMFHNDGSGNFVEKAFAPITNQGAGYYSLELIDVDGDGLDDLVAGGHEWVANTSTKLWINPGDFDFSSAVARNLPAVAGHGVILDFYWQNQEQKLYVLRTAGGQIDFYAGTTLQEIDWPTLDSRVVQQNSGDWTTWITPIYESTSTVLRTDMLEGNLNYTIESSK